MGDGECHEGTIWESANVASNRALGNLCAIVDWNGSAAQLMPEEDLPARWRSFGWRVIDIDGHNRREIRAAFENINFSLSGQPTVVSCFSSSIRIFIDIVKIRSGKFICQFDVTTIVTN